MDNLDKHILITGGCGYVGSVLAPKLARKYPVTVLDSMLFGNHLSSMPNITVVKGDIRSSELLRSLLSTTTDVIHLASIANDPCSDLDPDITIKLVCVDECGRRAAAPIRIPGAVVGPVPAVARYGTV